VSGEPASRAHGDEVHDPAGPRPVTYDDASRLYGPGTRAASGRYDDLSMRDFLAGAYAKLRASGQYDPDKHGTGSTGPLTVAEHLELLATQEYLSRAYKPSFEVDLALRAGATWAQLAEALGTDEASARAAYREWADGQHHLLTWTDGRIGMSDAEHESAIERAAGPNREAGQLTGRAGNRAPLAADAAADQARQDAREAGS
jgi:hypothetical protein